MMIRYLLASVATVAIATAASAQDVPATTPADQGSAETPAAPPGQSSAVAPSEDESGISTIVVTASRREENVQRSALSIQAIGSEDLIRANITKPEDLSSIAVGVQIGVAGPNPQVYIRGVGNYATAAYAESAVAMNLDGVYVSRSWATRATIYDLERVEVLKGPQGTLYGRNASGGAVNFITAKPRLGELGGFGEAQVGNYNLLQATAAINIPLGDTLAIRAAGQIVNRDGYLSDGTSDDKEGGARLHLLWKPTSDVSLLLTGQYQQVGGKGTGGVLKPQLPGDKFRAESDPAVCAIFRAQPVLGPFNTCPSTDVFTDIKVYSVSAELNWDFGPATLTVLPAYRDAKLNDKHYLPGFGVENHEHNEQTSVEARLGNANEKLKWVLGGYYFDERSKNVGGEQALIVTQGVNTQITGDLDYHVRSYAAFGQATYSLTDALRATGGLRYTYERKTLDEQAINFSFPNMAGPPCTPPKVFDLTTPTPPLFCRLNFPINDRKSFESVTYKAGLEYDLAPRSMAYANLSTGFKSGGFYSAPPPNSFDPEKLTAVDVGVKNRFLNNTLQVNVEAFYWWYKDHQESFTGPTSIPGFFAFKTVNAGKAHSYGVDLDVLYQPTPQDEVTFKVQYNKSKYDTFAFEYISTVFGPPTTGCATSPLPSGNTLIDCSGLPLVRTPLWNGTAGYSHTFELGEHGNLRASLDTQFASKSYLSIDFLEAGQQKSYIVGNADLTYTSDNKRWSVSAWMLNITNKLIYNQTFRSPFVNAANPLADPDGVFIGSVRAPRTYGARVRVNF